MTRIASPAFAFGLVLAAQAAHAQPSSKAKSDATAAYQEGQRRYLDEDYLGAAQEFEVAYKLDPDPAYEFNIAQAYRLGKDCTQALAWYRKFRHDAPKAPNLDSVDTYISDLEASCNPTSQPAPAPAPVPAQPAAEAPAQPGHLTRYLGIGAFFVGGVGLAAGLGYTLAVRSAESDREKLCAGQMLCVWTADLSAREAELKARGDRDSELAVAGFVVGGAAVAAGVVLLAMDWSARHTTRESAVMVVPTQGGAFVSFSLTR